MDTRSDRIEQNIHFTYDPQKPFNFFRGESKVRHGTENLSEFLAVIDVVQLHALAL